MKKIVKKTPVKTLDDLDQLGFGTGLAMPLFDLGAQTTLAAGLQGVNTLFSNHRGNADGNMFNYNEGGQMMAMGGEVDPPVKTSPNYTKTKDPNIYMGKFGVPITMDDYKKNLKSDLPFNSFDSYADWVGGWAKPIGGDSSAPAPVNTTMPAIQPSNKAKNLDNLFYPSKNQQTSTAVPTMPHTQYAMGGQVPVEVEGGEVAQAPNGQMAQFQGPSHEQGGISANLPQGTKVYSDRLAIDGKTMQQRKQSREKQVGKFDKLLDKNPTDTINRDTFSRVKNFADMQEQQDLSMQEAANQIYQKIPQLQDPGQYNQSQLEQGQGQQGQLADLGQVQPANIPRFAMGTSTSGVESNPYPGMADFAMNFNPSDALLAPTPGYTKPGMSTDVVDNNHVMNTDMPYSPGDKLGFMGNILGGALPLATTLANRTGDTPNVNSFQNFGKDAIAANNKAMGFMGQVRDNTLSNLNLQATGQRTRNRNSATGVNTSRALDLTTNAQEGVSTNNAYASYAQQMAGLYNEQSKLSNQKDLYTDTGAQGANRADRMDRDSFFTNLGQNFGNISNLTQKTGKEINEHDYNNQVLSLLPELSKYGLGFTYDDSGKPVLSKVK